MNLKDIALLKYKDIENGKIEFYRAKTKTTSKSDIKPITVFLNDFTLSVIDKYGNPNKGRKNYVFDIVSNDMSAERKQKAIKNFTRFINQHIKTLCSDNKLPHNISTYWARHSFASNFIASGGSIVDIMESMGHSNNQTTQNYLRSFDSDTKKKLLTSLMDFD
jgi:integrase